MIKNDFQFRLYFYQFILDSECYHLDNIELLEQLKHYLLVHGYTIFYRDEHKFLKSRVCRDFDDLYLYYLKYDEIMDLDKFNKEIK